MRRLAIITTHPIQYNAPLFRLLTERGKIQVKVFYTWGEAVLQDKYDPGFGKTIQWDIPMVEGYDHHFTKNVAKDPGSHHFAGINNPDLVSEINSFDPDAILVFGWSFKSHLKVIRHYSGKIQILFRGDSTLLNSPIGFSLKKLLRKAFLRWVYSHVDAAFYVGSHNKDYFLHFGLKENQLIFAPHAIDNDRFSISSTDHFREQLRISEDEVVFLFAGKFEPVKNPGLLLEAFIESGIKNARLVFVGNGPLENALKNTASACTNIHFLPFQNQSQMPGIYQSADAYVLPSGSETWGLAVNEAMASGKAILSSDMCGCAVDLVKNRVNGFVFISGDKNDLILKLQTLANDRAELLRMGSASGKIIELWNFEEICQKIEKYLIKY